MESLYPGRSSLSLLHLLYSTRNRCTWWDRPWTRGTSLEGGLKRANNVLETMTIILNIEIYLEFEAAEEALEAFSEEVDPAPL